MINFSTYFFEESKRGYDQYPQDFAAEMFMTYGDNFVSDSQIVVHRHQTLMYYTYMKKLSEEKEKSYFGISVVINGSETTSIKSLYKIFEKVFQQIVAEGEILTVNANGDVVSTDIIFSSYVETFNRLSLVIKNYLEQGADFFSQLLPVNYSLSNQDFKRLSYDEKESYIQQNLKTHNILYITKTSSTTFNDLTAAIKKIKELNEQLDYLRKRNEELEIIVSGKSHFDWRFLAIIAFIILIMMVFFFAYCFYCEIISLNL